MTIAQRIVDLLNAPHATPLQQIDIASRLDLIEASVRRTVQQLTAAGKTHVADYRGVPYAPRFLAGPRTLINTAPASNGTHLVGS